MVLMPPVRLHFVRKTVLRFTSKSPVGYIAFGQGENSIKTGPKHSAGWFETVLGEFSQEITSRAVGSNESSHTCTRNH
jgi:hypothetical protein